MKLLSIIFLLSISGCVPKHGKTESSTFMSPCIDGTIVNMSVEGCTEFSINSVPQEGYMDLACSSPGDLGFWTATKFRAYSSTLEEIIPPDGYQGHCVDQRTIMFVSPKEFQTGL